MTLGAKQTVISSALIRGFLSGEISCNVKKLQNTRPGFGHEPGTGLTPVS